MHSSEVRSVVVVPRRAYHCDMNGNGKNPSGGEPDQTERVVPDKQVYRWKDDGGALAPEPDFEPTQDESRTQSDDGSTR